MTSTGYTVSKYMFNIIFYDYRYFKESRSNLMQPLGFSKDWAVKKEPRYQKSGNFKYINFFYARINPKDSHVEAAYQFAKNTDDFRLKRAPEFVEMDSTNLGNLRQVYKNFKLV